MKETHTEHSKRVLGKTPATPCYAGHITFGGRCLNCGYAPEKENQKIKGEVKKDE